MKEINSEERYALKLKESVDLLNRLVCEKTHEIKLECKINDVVEKLGLELNFKAWRVEKEMSTFIYSYKTNTVCIIKDREDFNIKLFSFILSHKE